MCWQKTRDASDYVEAIIIVNKKSAKSYLRFRPTALYLTVSPYRQSSFGRRAFSAGGQMVWNWLSHDLRDPVTEQ